ncbi:hypothetical protein D3C78_1125540 [compost metagenome]
MPEHLGISEILESGIRNDGIALIFGPGASFIRAVSQALRLDPSLEMGEDRHQSRFSAKKAARILPVHHRAA